MKNYNMNLTKEEINKLALLARLDLTEEEKEKFRLQLGSILEYVSKLNELDTASIGSIRQIAGLHNAWRDDAMRPAAEVEHELLINNFPKRFGDLLQTKEVFEE